ncbi:MAG TPA: histidine phosphatase family protein [Candidatus Thermoplasmatota archaeon]|nr:histidine phosphatase family protein [Candidatus Thermoplasmatota archaeon]
MGRIYLVRHGQTTANAEEIIQGPRIDAALSELGMRQATSVGEALARQPIQAVYTSPLTRARQTAEAVVQRHARAAHGEATGSLAVQVVPELYEMDYGNFIGQGYAAVRDEMDQVLDAWRMGFVDQSFPGGESAILAQHRIRPFASRLILEAAGKDVAVVAHGRINRVLLATVTGAGLQRLEEFPQSNAAITELEVDGGRAVVRRLNDTSHLSLASDAFS